MPELHRRLEPVMRSPNGSLKITFKTKRSWRCVTKLEPFHFPSSHWATKTPGLPSISIVRTRSQVENVPLARSEVVDKFRVCRFGAFLRHKQLSSPSVLALGYTFLRNKTKYLCLRNNPRDKDPLFLSNFASIVLTFWFSTRLRLRRVSLSFVLFEDVSPLPHVCVGVCGRGRKIGHRIRRCNRDRLMCTDGFWDKSKSARGRKESLLITVYERACNAIWV